jgi:long-chain acyl-CoA synthetase
MILSGLRERIGLERAEWVISGAAPLSRDVHEFLLALGLPRPTLSSGRRSASATDAGTTSR